MTNPPLHLEIEIQRGLPPWGLPHLATASMITLPQAHGCIYFDAGGISGAGAKRPVVEILDHPMLTPPPRAIGVSPLGLGVG